MKRALITGVFGQDGSYLAESLLADGYEVWGTVRSRPCPPPLLEAATQGRLRLIPHSTSSRLWFESRPDEIYHLAGETSPPQSFDTPLAAVHANCVATVELLETIRHFAPNAAVFVAGTMDMFGNAERENDGVSGNGWESDSSSKTEVYFRNEHSPAEPVSPYGATKLFVANMVRIYREQGLKVCLGIMGPHESPRRPERFVTRKITMAAARIELGLQEKLFLGNTSAVRCWFHAKDAVRAMRKMVEKVAAREGGDVRTFDYIVGNSNAWSVAEFAERAFDAAGLDWKNDVIIDESLVRASDVHAMRCDPSAIKYDLGWEPTISFDTLVEEMVLNDIEIAKGELK